MTKEAKIQRICVYAGSRDGARPAYVAAAAALGRAIATRGISIVYGGGKTGLMGALADAALAAGGKMIGVMPRSLVDKEIAHAGVHDFHVTDTMHERKKKMADLADAFIALPGGFGTFEELFEVITWAQIGLHASPIGIFDVDGYYAPLVALAQHACAEGFTAKEHERLYVVRKNADELLDALLAFEPPPLGARDMDRRWKKDGPA